MTTKQDKGLTLNRMAIIVTVASGLLGLMGWLVWLGIQTGETRQRVQSIEDWKNSVSEKMVTQRELEPQLELIKKSLERIDTKVDQIWRNPEKTHQP
jgi:predicted negative regulator of RcsB-dependent stress response